MLRSLRLAISKLAAAKISTAKAPKRNRFRSLILEQYEARTVMTVPGDPGGGGGGPPLPPPPMMISQAKQASAKVDSGWRYTDGYWNYYDPDDRAWYHTDGKNWYTYVFRTN